MAIPKLEYAFVVFVDLRGFTTWSSLATVGFHLQAFMTDLYSIFQRAPGIDSSSFLKPNGDGVLLVKSTGSDDSPLNDQLNIFLVQTLPFVQSSFADMIHRYQKVMRCAIPLRLGFGINAGIVHRLACTLADGTSVTDFASGTLNTAARLCDLARPAGVVIAADAFPDWIPSKRSDYQLAEVNVKNISPAFPVWLSREIFAEAMPREARQVTLEFHVGTVCYDPKKESILLARRRTDRVLYPGLWETGGGQLYREEGIEDAAKRIARTEFGVEVEVDLSASIAPFKIETPRVLIPGIKVLCICDLSTTPSTPDEGQHTDIERVSMTDLLSSRWRDEDLIEGTKYIVTQLVTGFKLAKASTS